MIYQTKVHKVTAIQIPSAIGANSPLELWCAARNFKVKYDSLGIAIDHKITVIDSKKNERIVKSGEWIVLNDDTTWHVMSDKQFKDKFELIDGRPRIQDFYRIIVPFLRNNKVMLRIEMVGGQNPSIVIPFDKWKENILLDEIPENIVY